MAIEFRCSQCSQLLRVPDDSSGKNARCPKCQSLMTVPAASQAAASQPATPLAGGSPFSPLAPSSGPAQPPQPAADPFAFLNQPGGGAGGPMPPPPNPFGEVGGLPKPPGSPFGATYAAPSLNPYATPSAFGYSAPVPYGPRSGLPWESQGQSIQSWWQTMTLVLGSPSQAFAQMRQTGGLGGPILYNFWGLGAPMALVCLLVIPIVLLVMFTVPNNADGFPKVAMAVGMGVGFLLAAAFYVLLLVTVGAIIWSAVIHVCLLMAGGAKQGFETTFRVVSFTQGSITPLGIILGCIPYIGGLIHIVWITVVTIIGISKAHEIPTGKAAFAVLLPVGVCVGLGVAWIAFMVAMDANR